MKKTNSIFTWTNKSFKPFTLNIESSLKISNTIFNNNEFMVEFENNDNPRFESFHNQNIIYLPKKQKLKTDQNSYIIILYIVQIN